MGWTDKLIKKHTGLIAEQHGFSQGSDEYTRLETAISVIYFTVPKTAGLILAAAFLGIIPQLAVLFTVYNVMRWQAMGIHLHSNMGCFLFGMILYLGCTELALQLPISWPFMIDIYLILFILFCRYAPSGWETRPVTEVERKIKRNNSLLLVTIFFGIAFFLPHPWRELVIWGCIAEVVNILPITYTIFKERRFA